MTDSAERRVIVIPDPVDFQVTEIRRIGSRRLAVAAIAIRHSKHHSVFNHRIS